MKFSQGAFIKYLVLWSQPQKYAFPKKASGPS